MKKANSSPIVILITLFSAVALLAIAERFFAPALLPWAKVIGYTSLFVSLAALRTIPSFPLESPSDPRE